MRIVVTGATGNTGTALLRRLGPDPRWTVTGVARRAPDRAAEPYRHAEWAVCDLGDDGAVDILTRLFDGADAVVHLAWAIHPSRGDPPMWRTNVTGTRHLLRAVADAGVPHLVAGSSVAAYSPAPRWSPVSEGWPREGITASAYSRGKVWLERELDGFAERHPRTRVTRLRPCAILQHDAGGQFTRWLLGALVPGSLIGRPWLPVPLWPKLRAQAVHADDVARAITAALERTAEGAFNLAAEPVLRASDLAAAFGGPRLPVPRPAAASVTWLTWRGGLYPLHPGWLALADKAALVDTTRARIELDWVPRHDTSDTIAALAAGLRTGAGTASAPLAPAPADPMWARLRAVPWGRPTHQSQA